MDDYDEREAAEAFDYAMQCKEEKLKQRIEVLEELLKWVLGTIGHDHPAKKAIRAALGEKKDG